MDSRVFSNSNRFQRTPASVFPAQKCSVFLLSWNKCGGQAWVSDGVSASNIWHAQTGKLAFMSVQSLSNVQCFATPWTVACQAPLSMGGGGLRARTLAWLPCPPLGDLPNPGVEPGFPALQANSSPSSESQFIVGLSNISYIQTGKAQQSMHYRKSYTTLLQQLVLLMFQHYSVKKTQVQNFKTRLAPGCKVYVTSKTQIM